MTWLRRPLAPLKFRKAPPPSPEVLRQVVEGIVAGMEKGLRAAEIADDLKRGGPDA